MKFTLATLLTFSLLAGILLLIEHYTVVQGGWWVWAQIVLASLMVGVINSWEKTK